MVAFSSTILGVTPQPAPESIDAPFGGVSGEIILSPFHFSSGGSVGAIVQPLLAHQSQSGQQHDEQLHSQNHPQRHHGPNDPGNRLGNPSAGGLCARIRPHHRRRGLSSQHGRRTDSRRVSTSVTPGLLISNGEFVHLRHKFRPGQGRAIGAKQREFLGL